MRFLSSPLIATALVLTSLMGLPALASDAPKKPAAKEEPPKPKFDYVEEEGEKGRSGYVYKRVAKPKFEEPQELPKAEPKEAHKPESKDAHGKKMTMASQTTMERKTMAMAHLPRKRKRRTTVTALLLRRKRRKKTMAMVHLKRTTATGVGMAKMPKSLWCQRSVRCTTRPSSSSMATTAPSHL